MKYLKKFESPDGIYNKELSLDLEYTDKDAVPFGYDSNILIIGVPRTTHAFSVLDRDDLIFPGRIWKDSKIISFWNPQPTKAELDKIVKDLNNNWNRFDKRRKPINIDGDWSIEINNELTKIKDYQGSNVRVRNVNHVYEYANKMTKIAQDELSKTPGGTEYFDKIDAALKLPQNLDVIKTIFQQIQKEQGTNFNLILTGGFGEWIHSLIKKGVLKVPGNLVTSCGSIRGGNDKLGKTTKGKDVDIIHKKDDIDNQQFIMFDDSYYSGSTKKVLEDYLKKFGSEISKTYVLYDGSDVKDPNRISLYRYYDHHTGTKLGVDLLIDYLYSLDSDIPKDSVRDKIVKGELNTINDIIVEVNKILVKFGKQPIDKMTHKETSNIIKSFEAFEYEGSNGYENSEVIYSILTEKESSKYIIYVWIKLRDVSEPKYPYLDLNCDLVDDITIRYYNDGSDGDLKGYYNFYPTKLSTITPPYESGQGITFHFEDRNGASRVISLYYIKKSMETDKIAESIYKRVSSYEFQKEFLMERPKDCDLLKSVGINPKIKEVFDYLWTGNEMGLL